MIFGVRVYGQKVKGYYRLVICTVLHMFHNISQIQLFHYFVFSPQVSYSSLWFSLIISIFLVTHPRLFIPISDVSHLSCVPVVHVIHSTLLF